MTETCDYPTKEQQVQDYITWINRCDRAPRSEARSQVEAQIVLIQEKKAAPKTSKPSIKSKLDQL